MAKSKLSLENSSLNWSDKRRYKVNAIVSYSGSTYQNITGKNSEPGVGSDWFKVPDTSGAGGPISTDTVTNNSNVAGTTATDALNTLDTKIPKDYAKIVYVNNNNPNSATIFDLNNPPTTNDNSLKIDTSNLYIGLDESSWVYNDVSLVYEVEVYTGKASNFNLYGTNKDAGNNKNSDIQRAGALGVGTATKPDHAVTKAQHDTKENSSNKTDTIAGNETSSSLFASIKGIVDWLTSSKIKSILGITTLSGSNTGDETATSIGALIGGAGDATPNDSDYVATALTGGGLLKKITWTNVKAFLKTYFDTQYKTDTISIAMSDTGSALVTGDTDPLQAPYNFILVNFWIAVKTAPTVSSLIVDVKKNGTSITSTKAGIDATEKTSLTGTSPVLTTTSFTKGDEITPNIYQTGSGESGRSLKLYLEIIKI